MGMITTVVLDADDTLWDMQVVFDAALSQFDGMMEAAGFDPGEARALQTKINVDLAHARGAAVANFGDSMVAAYMELTDKYDKSYYPRFAEALQGIASAPSLAVPEVIEGVPETLRALSDQGYQLLVLTAGEQTVQHRKLVNTSLLYDVDGFEIVAKKTADSFRDLMHAYGFKANQAVMVGNSLRSDINPATEAGLRAIWINHGGWDYDHEEMNAPWDVKIAQYFSDVPRLLVEIENEAMFWKDQYRQTRGLSKEKPATGTATSSKISG